MTAAMKVKLIPVNNLFDLKNSYESIEKQIFNNYFYKAYPDDKAILILKQDNVPVIGFRLRTKAMWENHLRNKLIQVPSFFKTIVYSQSESESEYESESESESESEPENESINFEEKYFELVKRLTKQNLTLSEIEEIIDSLEPVPNEWL